VLLQASCEIQKPASLLLWILEAATVGFLRLFLYLGWGVLEAASLLLGVLQTASSLLLFPGWSQRLLFHFGTLVQSFFLEVLSVLWGVLEAVFLFLGAKKIPLQSRGILQAALLFSFCRNA
jgi:hypothetical protein